MRSQRFWRWASFFVFVLLALFLSGVLDAELGDQHSDVERRSKMGVSIYISISNRLPNRYVSVALMCTGLIVGYILRNEGPRSYCFAICSMVSVLQVTMVIPTLLRFQNMGKKLPRSGHTVMWKWSFHGNRDIAFQLPVLEADEDQKLLVTTFRVQSTRQQQVASGYTYFENMYYANSTFILVRGLEIDSRRWALMSNEESMLRWGEPGRFASREHRGFGSRLINPNASMLVDMPVCTSVSHSIMITDFLPSFNSHLFHMLEHLVGIWATAKTFMVNSSGHSIDPDFIFLPQNSLSEIGDTTQSLVATLFPGCRVLDRETFGKFSSGRLIHFRSLVASDRSAADHGGVNQMITGILPYLPPYMPSFTATVLQNAGARPACLTCDWLTLTFVDRQHSNNRRLSRGLSKELLWRLGTAHPRMLVHWTRFQDLPYHKQVQRASDTHILMGVHGNGLSYSLFIKKPGAVIEIFPGRDRLLAYQQFAEARDLLYFGLESGSGVVHRERSCACRYDEDRSRLFPPPNCTERHNTINTIINELDLALVIEVVRSAASQVEDYTFSSHSVM